MKSWTPSAATATDRYMWVPGHVGLTQLKAPASPTEAVPALAAGPRTRAVRR